MPDARGATVRNRFEDPQIRAIREIKDQGRRALEILKPHRDFPRIQLQIMEGTEEVAASAKDRLPKPELPSDDRLRYAIQLLDLRAANYVQLVSDLKSQEAFTKLLLSLRRAAWEEYRGIAEIEPIVGNKELEQIDKRVLHWRKESYKRCIPKEDVTKKYSRRRLPGLLPTDPENRLSDESRKRVHDAHLDAERITWEAEANIDNKGIRDSSKAHQLRNTANLKAARTVLKVLHVEYSGLDISLREFWECMKQEIESAANSLELHATQRRLLEVEFFKPANVPKIIDPELLGTPEISKPDDEPPTLPPPFILKPSNPPKALHRKASRIPTTVNNLAAAERMEAFITLGTLDQTQFATQAGTTDRTLRSFRRTGKVRRHIFDGIAKAMGLTPDDLLKTGK